MRLRPAKTAEQIEILLGMETAGAQRTLVLIPPTDPMQPSPD